ncbi:A-kinase anchor protein 1, mitochondrial [Bagarius yarrelli]|uniref:A-kinase anchor protein 1, mitochondrial n=1 Tax=Bagarius yarrelli TaxID=175774 RepID=A0A556U3I5_BAGYA|nr:A-kinase anchor protein 1, mitochondrial [Bagarius yarrelli]
MLQLPLKPLVPLSALALLGWCWYTFRKKRAEKLLVSSTAKNQSMAEKVDVREAAASKGTPETQDVKIHCYFQSQEKPEDDQNLDDNFSQPSSTMEELSVLSGASLATIVTSTPLKGIRPEPEGEVSKARAFLLLAEKPETETDKMNDKVKSHSDGNEIKEPETETGSILCEAECPGVQVIGGATEEIKAILKRKGLPEPVATPEVKTILVDTEKDLGALTKTVEKSVSSAHKPIEPLLEEDSGCSTFHSENGVEAKKTFSESQAVEKTSTVSVSFKAVEPRNEKLSRQNSVGSKDKHAIDFATGVRCVNGERSRAATNRAMQSRNSLHTMWSIEVPAHLVGRLIGKKGKHISSLKQNSGAKIHVSTLPYTYEFQICHVEGSEVQVEKALVLLRKKFKDLDLRNRLSSLQPAGVHSLPITSWLPLPQDGTVEVIVLHVEAANYLFVQQHTHPTYYGLCSLTEQMLFCYSHLGCPNLPTPVKAGVLCAAPSPDGAWWRAQVIQHYKDSDVVQIRYVDYGGYVTVNLSSLKQIRADFVTLPFQASEVMLENLAPLPGDGKFSDEAKAAVEELTQGIPLIMKVTSSQNGLPLVHIWRQVGEEMISVNGTLVDRGLCSWLDSH